MAREPFEEIKIEHACPGCGRKSKQIIRKGQTQRNFTCPGCGAAIELDTSQAGRTLDKVGKAFAKLGQRLNKPFKRR